MRRRQSSILRVTLSLQHDSAVAAPGFGFVGAPQGSGWRKTETDQADIYRSARVVATVEREHPPVEPPESQKQLAEYFIDSTPGAHITFSTPDGKKLLELTGWSQRVPNHKDGTAQLLNDRRPSDPEFYTVGATFASPDEEHYYGLGGNQEGFLDHRGHPVRCWNDYRSAAGPTTCVPFLITNKGYAVIWDNPSKTLIEPGFNEQTRWSSQVGERVSFFVIAGTTADDLYAGYRLLTNPTPMLPKAAYGYIQSKQRYSSQDELLSVAKGYRDRHLPADVLVVDWFYYTKMGQMDIDPKYWPDPVALPADPVYLLVGLSDVANRSPIHVRATAGFPQRPNVADLCDEYMFGPAFLVAPSKVRSAAKCIYPPAATGTTTGPMNA
jgi:alpha-D-xyloside xylohydrolase